MSGDTGNHEHDTCGECADAHPSRFAGVHPGAQLAALLASVDHRSLCDFELLEYIAAHERQVAFSQSAGLDAIAAFAERSWSPDLAPGVRPVGEPVVRGREFAAEEIAARLRISRNAARTRLANAHALRALPCTRAALSAGRIDLARARMLSEELAALDPVTAREVEATVVPKTETRALAAARPIVRRAVLAADTAAAHKRAVAARTERQVRVFPEPDGMATIWARVPATSAMAVSEALGAYARAAKAAGDERTMDQLRADALVAPFHAALATGELPGAAHEDGTPWYLAKHRGETAAIRITAAAGTLLGHDDHPVTLHGYGPITPDSARELVDHARLQRVLTDPCTGTVVEVGDVYRPTASLTRFVETRDATCRGVDCRHPAETCELDHRVPFPHGPTTAANLDPRCKRHHRLKSSPGVKVERIEDGMTVWTYPTGHTYRVEPHRPGLPAPPSEL